MNLNGLWGENVRKIFPESEDVDERHKVKNFTNTPYTASEREYIDSAKDDKTRELRTKIVENKRSAYQRSGVGNAVDYIKRAGSEPESEFNREHINMMTQARKDGFEVSRGEDGKVRLYANGTGEEPERTDVIKNDGIVHTYTGKIPTTKNIITGNNPVTKEEDYTIWNPATQHEDGTLLKNERPFRVELTPEEQKELDTPIRWEDYDPRLRVWAEAHPEEFRRGRISQILDRRIGPNGREGYYHDIDPKTMGWKTHSLKWDAISRAWVNEENDPLVEKYLQRHPELKQHERTIKNVNDDF